MRKLVTDTPEDNIQAALNLFYIKNGWTWVRGGGPGPKYEDVSLCDYVRGMIKAHIPDAEIPGNDDDLSMMMAEWVMDGPESIEGLIATVYEAGWAFSELRHRLKNYEATGLTYEECVPLAARMKEREENDNALVKELRETVSRSKGKLLKNAADTIERLERELKEVSAERDDAVACLKILADRNGECVGCIREDFENGCGDATCDAKKNNHWEWRGQKGEGR